MSGPAGFSIAALQAALTRLPRLADLSADALEPMPLKGVAHDHVRLRGRRLVARIPRWSQLGLDAWTALERQAAAESWKPKPIEASANEVTPPAKGWDEPPVAAKKPAKPGRG